MKFTVLVGHRGIGKSSLLKRISKYLPQSLCFCLDEEIEKRVAPIEDIFKLQGESKFREIEKEIFRKILLEANTVGPVFIAVGGGFPAEEIPSSARILWIRRDWDVSQNIFFDRPSLSQDLNDLRIPQERYTQREQQWKKLGCEELTLPEGSYDWHPGEDLFFKNHAAGGTVTLLPEALSQAKMRQLVDRKPQWIELRDDLLSEEQLKAAIEFLPSAMILLSFRNSSATDKTSLYLPKAHMVDWPIEFGDCPFKVTDDKIFYSYHSDENSFDKALTKLNRQESRIKWSPEIKNFLQLRMAHEWMMQKPSQRALLPRSKNSRWTWYRQLMRDKMFINFWRESSGSALDQPSLIEWLVPPPKNKFAAVLGQPVLQSWSPAFHAQFFSQKNQNFYAIEVDEQELSDGAWDFLQQLGICAAAVTSPHKQWAGKIAGQEKPLNTLVLSNTNKWLGANTDDFGFRQMLLKSELSLDDKTVAVWGGGDIIPSLQLPHAIYYSARTGLPRENSKMTIAPDVLIWAAGWQSTESIPSDWRPRWVLDLNYRADSPARGYAHRVQAKYISGDVMFFKQAQEQQKIWSQYEWS
ncbi:hypothetical protein K2X05_14545 [bacterium]|nr:hypothetical protein [bacterium]